MKCNLCEFDGEFLEAGEEKPYRIKATCPKCSSAERHRLYKIYLTECLLAWENKKVLEIGAFAMTKFFNTHSLQGYINMDFLKDKSMIIANANDIPFKDNYFDFIFCVHVLGWSNDYKNILREIYRVLKVGGIAIIQVPQIAPKVLWIENFKVALPNEILPVFDEGEGKKYSPSYKACLEASGFKVNIVKFFNTLDVETIFKYNPANEDIYEAVKI